MISGGEGADDRRPVAVADIPGLDLIREIGRGAMGVVYLAHQRSLDRLVAVKMLQPFAALDHVMVERFRREARAAAVIDAAIVPVHDVGEVGGNHYLIMAYMPGGNLRQVVERRRLTSDEVVLVGRQIGGALATAHASGVIHRDVKPSNILLDGQGHPFLADFGVARLADDTSLTVAGAAVGTADYMAPELAEGQPHSAATDVYALGATLYECAAGRPPFVAAEYLLVVYQHRHEPVPPLPDDVPRPLAEVVMRSLAKDPGQRLPDATALVEALERLPGAGQAAMVDLAAAPPSDRPTVAPAVTRTGGRVRPQAPAGPTRVRPGRLPHRMRRPAALALLVVLLAVASLGATAGVARLGTLWPSASQWLHAPAALPPVTFANGQVVGVGACCFTAGGRWNRSSPGGYPDFGGPIAWTTSPGSTATWSLGPTSRGKRWDRVRVQVWIPNHLAGAWVRYTVTASAGGVAKTSSVVVAQQPNQGPYPLGTYAAGTPTERTGSVRVRMTYLRPYTGPAADASCARAGCTEMAAAQVMFNWS